MNLKQSAIIGKTLQNPVYNMYELHKHNHSPAPLRNFLDNDNGAFPNRPLSRAAVTNPAGCGQIRLVAAPIISGGGGGVTAAPAFRTSPIK